MQKREAWVGERQLALSRKMKIKPWAGSFWNKKSTCLPIVACMTDIWLRQVDQNLATKAKPEAGAGDCAVSTSSFGQLSLLWQPTCLEL